MNKEMSYQAKVKQIKSQEERWNVSNAEDVCSQSSSAVISCSLAVNVRPQIHTKSKKVIRMEIVCYITYWK